MTTKTILIVDTDTDTIQKIMSTLESEDYLVFTASDRDVSIQMAKKVNPSLIFINIGMSGASGLEICKTIHDTETLKNVPIVIITPHGGAIDSRYTALYGIVDFLKKPFTSEELVSKTNNMLAIEFVEAEPTEETAAQPIEEVTTQPVEEEIDVKLFEEEGIRAKPTEEEMEVRSVEDETEAQLVEEEWMVEEPVKEKMEAKPIKEETEVKPAEDELDALLMEEEIESGKGKEPGIPEKIPDVQKGVPEEIVSDKSELGQMRGEIKEETTGQIPSEEPEETLSGSTVVSEEAGKTNISKKRIRDRGRRRSLLIPIVVLVLITIAAGGYFIYTGLWQEAKVQIPFLAKSVKTVQQQPPKVEPFKEHQISPKAVEESKPAPIPAPAQEKKPEVKPEVKPIYSVQIGVFKNEANAAAIVRKYKEKGYDAFTCKSTAKDKGILYRVLIGNFANKKEDAKLANSVREKENINVIIFHE